MKRKTTYIIVSIFIIIGVYGYEHFLKEEEVNIAIETGEIEKNDTKSYFLPSSTTGQIIHHEGYSLSYKEKYEQAEWVAYELKKSHLSKSKYKRPFFEIDRAVKTGASHWRNYKNSGFDRGHLCPAGDRRYSQEAHDETFLTSNISPQDHDFNAGVWNRLEQKVRYWARKYDGLFVVTGGVLNGEMETIGDEYVAVPNQFYKVLLDYNSDNPKMIGFLLPNRDSRKPLYEFVVSVDSLEKSTGIDFFPSLEDALERQLETSNSYKSWSFY